MVCPAGVDPTTKLQRLLKDLNENVDMLEMLSLGRGQGPRIEEILRNAMQRGKWVFLQNCHLGHSWLQNLQKVIHRLPRDFSFKYCGRNVSPYFALFLILESALSSEKDKFF